MTGWPLPHTYDSDLGAVRWNRLGGSGPPVVLLHGTPFSSRIWRDVGAALADGYQVFVWDMPGYGVSDRFEGQDLSLAAYGALFAGLLRHWGLARPLVVAHDSGGAVALGAHLRHGADYARLALVDAVSLAPWGSEFAGVAGSHPDVFARLPGPLHRALLRTYVASASSPGLRPDVLDALVAPWLGADGQAAFYRQLAQRRTDAEYTGSMQDRYATVAAPTLVCWGADDAWIPAARGHELAAVVPDARLRVIADAGHLLPCDRPAELTAALLGFLREPAG